MCQSNACSGKGDGDGVRALHAEDAHDDVPLRDTHHIASLQQAIAPTTRSLLTSVVKMKLTSFCKSPDLPKRLNRVVIDLNQVVGEAYAFANFHITRLPRRTGATLPRRTPRCLSTFTCCQSWRPRQAFSKLVPRRTRYSPPRGASRCPASPSPTCNSWPSSKSSAWRASREMAGMKTTQPSGLVTVI